MSLLGHAAQIAWKDLTIEVRTREIVYTMAFFAVVVILIFSFAFVDPGEEGGAPQGGGVPVSTAGGILWVAVTLAGTLGLGRAFDREREGDTMRALLLSPIPRGAVLLGKALGIAAFMLAVQLVIVPLTGLLFGAPLAARPGELIALLVLGTIAFAIVGAVFAAMLMRSRAREMLLPVMLYPMVIPALIAGVKGTSAIWANPAELAEAMVWIKLLVVYDAIFLAVALLAFESLVVE